MCKECGCGKPRSKKKSSMDWFDAPIEEVRKRTAQFAKGYLAHKSEETSSPMSHPEYMEQAELRAEQIRNSQQDEA